MGFDERWAEIRRLWREHQWLYIVAGYILGLLTLPLLARVQNNTMGFLQDLVPEAVGIVVTVLIIDRAIRSRAKRAEVRTLQRELIENAASPLPEVSKRAIDEMRRRNWLQGENGILQNANLQNANLQDVDLSEANLQGINLRGAYLKNVRLQSANISYALLSHVFFDSCDMNDVNMRFSRLLYPVFLKTNALNLDIAGGYMVEPLGFSSFWNVTGSQSDVTHIDNIYNFGKGHLSIGGSARGDIVLGVSEDDFDGINESDLLPQLTDSIARIRELALNKRPRNYVYYPDHKFTSQTIKNKNWRQGLFEQARFTGVDIRNTNMDQARLTRAHFTSVDVESVTFVEADLSNTRWTSTTIKSCNFASSDFDKSIFTSTDFDHSYAFGCGFRNCTFVSVDFCSANLFQSDLTGAKLVNVEFDDSTILPDGTNWTVNTDMRRFTDSTHPKYWNPARSMDSSLSVL